MSIFAIASEQLSAEQQPILHFVLPWISKLKSYCAMKNNDHPMIKEVKNLILEQMNDKIWLTQLHEIATFLHPMTKNLSVCR